MKISELLEYDSTLGAKPFRGLNLGYDEDMNPTLQPIRDLYNYQWFPYFLDSIEGASPTPADEAIQNFAQDFQQKEPSPEQAQKFQLLLQHFTTEVSGNRGIVYDWAVEYDGNLMFIYDVDEREFVDNVDWDEAASQQ